MKRLFKIIILFFLIFLVGIYFTIKSINNSFPTDNNIETIAYTPKILKLAAQVRVINNL